MRQTHLVGVVSFALGAALAGAWWLQPLFPLRAQAAPSAQSTTTSTTATLPQTINVSAEGRVAARPDEARLQLGVMTRAASVPDAMAQADQALNQMIQALRAAGVAETDMQTTSVFIGSEGPRGVPGAQPSYQASQQLTVRVRDLGKLSQLVSAAARATGDSFQMQGMQFTLSDPATIQSQARQQALQAAQARAEELARLSGHTLGAIIAISEGATPPIIPLAGGLGGGAAGPSQAIGFLPGEQEYVVVVQVTYSVR